MIRYQEIASQLASGYSSAGSGLHAVPSENDLCRHYGASRTTIRAALRQLEVEGLVERRQGSGTFYRPRHIEKDLGSIVDFQTEARLAGRVPRTQVIALFTRSPDAGEVSLFGSGLGAGGVVEIVRLRSLDDQPAVLQRSCLAQQVIGPVTGAALEDTSLYGYLARQRGVVVARVSESLEPRAAEPEQARLLGIPSGTAVFQSHRIARDVDGAVIEVSDNLIRGDVYRFIVHRPVSPDPADHGVMLGGPA